MLEKLHPTIACCGLDCGLYPSYHIDGTSKCPGCFGPNFSLKHPSCGVMTCCAKKKDLEVCALCEDFPCAKIENRLDSPVDSILTYKNLRTNLTSIQQKGLAPFLDQQKQRIDLLETMLREFNDGRSKCQYCLAATLLPIEGLEQIIQEMDTEIAAISKDSKDKKIAARLLKDRLNALAAEAGIELKLRKKTR